MDAKVYIQDAFRYLVSNAGTCEAILVGEKPNQYWTVHICGRLYKQTWVNNRDNYHFECKTEHGTVSVSFAKKGR